MDNRKRTLERIIVAVIAASFISYNAGPVRAIHEKLRAGRALRKASPLAKNGGRSQRAEVAEFVGDLPLSFEASAHSAPASERRVTV